MRPVFISQSIVGLEGFSTNARLDQIGEGGSHGVSPLRTSFLSVPTVPLKFSFSILTTQKLRRRIPVLSLKFLFPLFLLCRYQPSQPRAMRRICRRFSARQCNQARLFPGEGPGKPMSGLGTTALHLQGHFSGCKVARPSRRSISTGWSCSSVSRLASKFARAGGWVTRRGRC